MKRCMKCGKTAQDDEIYCLNCGSLLEEIASDQDRGSKPGEAADKAVSADGKKPDKKSGKGKKILCLVIMALLALCAVIACVIAIQEHSRANRYEDKYFESNRKINYELKPEIASLEEENAQQAAELETMASQIAVLAQQTEWMDTYIAIIDENSDEMLYHTYSCSSLDWSGSWSIRAYNVNLAKKNGYEPCTDCHAAEPKKNDDDLP